MWFMRAAEGYLFGALTPSCIETLRGVPMLIESEDERVRARLLPETYEDHESEAHWRAHAAPELERLFVARTVLVRKDLMAMRQLDFDDSGIVLMIPDSHVNAWLATLNAARLALFVLNEMTAAHFERKGLKICTPKQAEAVARIHFLAGMQEVLLGTVDHGEEEDPQTDAAASE
ncbi:hypothetical protein LBMAG49_29100 [Planctomycetota bacterium]|jgi:hypothetical protein|nr:hypothetical protein LBMAG49_29100 [Planctomycetota bacterium]